MSKVLLKISGEALSGDKGFGIDYNVLNQITDEIKEASDLGNKIAIVVGGGNYWRGRQYPMHRQSASDEIGMLATAMNSLAICDSIQSKGKNAVVQTSIDIQKFCESYNISKAMDYLDNGAVVILGCGTGNTCFSTDTAAVLRAIELQCDIVLKATMVDGVYDKDPKIYPDAVKYNKLKFDEIIEKKLNVVDLTAAALCMEHKMPLMVFDISAKNGIVDAVCGKEIGTMVEY